MNRLVYISFDELRVDHDACAAMLNGAASRSPRMYVSGLASDDRGVVVSMEESSGDTPVRVYNFALAESLEVEEFMAELSARYYAGFSMLGGFVMDGCRWVLYARESES